MFCINFSVSDSQPTAMLHTVKTTNPIIDKDSGSFDYKYGLILDIMNESVDLIRQRIVNYVENLSWENFRNNQNIFLN